MMKKLFTIFLTLIFSITLHSQKLEVRFGKATKADLEMTECEFYPEAKSMILAESGDISFLYNNEKGWQYAIRIIKRIKIFDYQDKDIANIKLTFYDPEDGQNREFISSLKAITYNLDKGKILKTKLSNKEEHETRISDYRKEISFAMPDVNEGSIIEYQYTLTSDFYSTLYTWHFQNDIPTLRSELRYTIPEFFNYSASQVGNIYPTERMEGTQSETFTYKYETLPGAGGASQKGTGSVSSLSKQVVMVASKIPPIIDEPYQNNRKSIPYRLEFQHISTQMPGSTMKMIASDYAQFNETMLKSDGVGSAANKGFFFRNIADELEGTPLDKAVKIYDLIQNQIAFNNVYSSYSTNAGKHAYNDGVGSSSDINLTLVATLRQADLDANPVLVSTRGNGVPHPVYPNFNDFNYLIASVKIDGNLYLLDATTDLSFGYLPVRCLNNKGWMVSKPQGQWVDLKSNAKYNISSMVTSTFEGGVLLTKHDVKYGNYAYFSEKDNYLENEDEYRTTIENRFPDTEISDIEVENDGQNFTVHFVSEKEIDGESVTYIQPIGYEAITNNPFKREERLSPIDFEYLTNRRIMHNITIPEGYTAELPKPSIVKLPGGTAKFTYSANLQGNRLTVMSLFEIKKSTFSSKEYPMLKQFYDLVAKKHGEMIVLKKI